MGAKDTQVVDINDRKYWSLSQLASAFGFARETISKRLKQADVLASKQRSGHDVFHIRDAAQAILAGEFPTFEGIKDPDKLLPKDRLDWYKSENEKRRHLLESGQAVLVDEATAEMAGIVKICIRTLDIIPDLLEMKCGLSPTEIQLVENECDNARTDLASKLAE